ncbi:hypothetical protein [Psychroserpens ponticola]|uniref:ABC-type transport auxiliary lipoprotein component domain-containing protein n=1 Tax=Psychroserpens ponticola TaxID=2932268 RepID=A0ABY7S2S0_9FLAO|nr:hypothetical protein [Psychroserpens ponticola]WCO03588.1 hypothetical protein MUN68_008775 [Psychroserpens ponticola]
MRNLLLILIILISSCASYDSNYSYEVKPIKFNPEIGKWIINKPFLGKNIDFSFENEVLINYKKYLNKKIGKEFALISEFNNLFLPKKDRTEEGLAVIYEQTKFDFLIDTSIDILKDELPIIDINTELKRQKEIRLIITIYDLKSKDIILKKEHFYNESFDGNNDIAFSSKINKLISFSIKKSIKGLKNKHNWN